MRFANGGELLADDVRAQIVKVVRFSLEDDHVFAVKSTPPTSRGR